MGIYYYAVDVVRKKYFSSPDGYGIKFPSIFHPSNPFPHMVVMQNAYGCNFEIWNDVSNDIPPEDGYEDITEKVYQKYLTHFPDYFNQNEQMK